MDGTDRRVIVDTDVVWPNGMSIDFIGQRLYWIDVSLHQIKSTRFDGSNTYTVIKDSFAIPWPYDLVVYNSYIYWSNWQNGTICRANKFTGQDFAVVAKCIWEPMGIQMFGAGVQLKDLDVCGQNNGGCSHICFPLPAYNTTKSTLSSCMCPDYYAMQADKKTCLIIEPPSNIMIEVVGTFVTISWKFPLATYIIRETDLKVYDSNNNLIYSAIVYPPTTTHVITTVQLKTCLLYTVKLSCQYYQLGWSKPIEQAFWRTDNVIYSKHASSVNISWTTTTDRTHFDIAFNKLSDNSTSTTDYVIYSDMILQNNASKYDGLLKNGRYVQFTLNHFVKEDAGLYKSMDILDSTLIDGCALLVFTDKPLKPELTYDRYPFVGGKTSFKCNSQLKCLPSFMPYSLKYMWSLDKRLQSNVLEINPIAKVDKGKVISCKVYDDKGDVSDSSDTLLLDPFYGPDDVRLSILDGPDDVRLSILGESVNATKGNTFGPITCAAECYPKCNYVWKRFASAITTDVMIGQNLVIAAASFEDSGTYTCIIEHQNDSSRVRTISMEVIVQNSSVQLPTILPETTILSSATSKISSAALSFSTVTDSSVQLPTTLLETTVVFSSSNASKISSATTLISTVTDGTTNGTQLHSAPQSEHQDMYTNKNEASIAMWQSGIYTKIMYSSIAGGVCLILIVIVVIICVCRRLQNKQETENPPNSTIDSNYDSIDDRNLMPMTDSDISLDVTSMSSDPSYFTVQVNSQFLSDMTEPYLPVNTYINSGLL